MVVLPARRDVGAERRAETRLPDHIGLRRHDLGAERPVGVALEAGLAQAAIDEGLRAVRHHHARVQQHRQGVPGEDVRPIRGRGGRVGLGGVIGKGGRGGQETRQCGADGGAGCPCGSRRHCSGLPWYAALVFVQRTRRPAILC